MGKKYFICIGIIFSLALFFIDSVHARFPSRGAHASRMTRSAISRSLDFKIKPRLNFSKIVVGPISSLALSSDEHYLITVVGKNKLRLWDLYAGREVALSTALEDEIINLKISPDSSLCIYICSDGSVYSWDFKTLKTEKIYCCPPSNLVAFQKNGIVIFGGLHGELTQFDPKVKNSANVHQIGTKPFLALEISETGPVLLVSKNEIFVVDKDSYVVVDIISTKDNITTIACSEDILLWGTEDGNIAKWNLGLNKKTVFFKNIKGRIVSLDVNSDKGEAVCGTNEGILYSLNLNSGKAIEIGKHGKEITFSRMDKNAENVLTASEDGTCKLWNLKSKQLQLTLVSAVDGWAVVDSKGRFDGTQAALEGVDWQDGEHIININNFSQAYYEPNLLPRVMHQDEKSAGFNDVAIVSDGIHLAAKVEIDGSVKSSQKAIIRVVGSDKKGSGIRDVKLYQNGKRVPESLAKTEIKSNKEGTKELVSEFSVKLGRGDNVFSAIAVNDELLESDPANIVFSGAKDSLQKTIWVVAIGINNYKVSSLNLDYARPDAQSLYNYFDKNQNLAVSQKKLLSLYDSDADNRSIAKVFKTLQYIPREDLVIVYMAGHGVIIGEEWYFLPSNISVASEENVIKNGISTKDLKNYIESVGADRIILFLDACQSGGALSPIKNFKGIKSLRMLARDVGVHVLAATDREQYAVELATLGHGVFTYSLLNALNGDSTQKDKNVTIRELMKFVEKEVPALSKKFANYAQFPVSHSRGNDFTLLKY
ncbi:caspase family protein [Maridesulfovibrio ferrireducens]|uniref:caspase family protein n=1 Tax=Maridesulfovibrio ferrireducens TaxID=246191 RepID=UPI001A1A1E8F|nr:caspase family protein [Maridesulfovibrio ferrireducens]MBI9113324.1 caspase family protein [Maridesulfovibrio ferrireducens]